MPTSHKPRCRCKCYGQKRVVSFPPILQDASPTKRSSATHAAFETMIGFSRHAIRREIKSIFPIDEFLDSKGPGFTLAHKIVIGEQPHLHLEDVLRADDRDVVSVDDDGRSPLFYAAEVGNAGAVALLIQHGAEVNRQDRFGLTALMGAAWFGQLECITTLLDAGADVHTRNGYGQTALFLSAQASRTACLERLLQGGADVNEPVHYSCGTVLHTVAYYGYVDVVNTLMDHGADAEACDDAGRTPLALALYWGFGERGVKLDATARQLFRRGSILGFADGFECRNHETDACYCVELIAELLAMRSGNESSQAVECPT